MDIKTLRRQTLSYIQLSTMSDKEKAMWTVMLPTMNEKELKKLHDILEKEINALMDLSASALSQNE